MSGEISLTGLLAVQFPMLPLAALPPAHWWGIAAVMALLACGGVYFILLVTSQSSGRKSAASKSAQPGPDDSTFQDLCRAHELDREDAALLTRAADELGLPSPVRLFVNPVFLKQFAETESASEGAFELLDQLFGRSLEADRGNAVAASVDAGSVRSQEDEGTMQDGVARVLSDEDSIDVMAATVLSDLPHVAAGEADAADETAGDRAGAGLPDIAHSMSTEESAEASEVAVSVQASS